MWTDQKKSIGTWTEKKEQLSFIFHGTSVKQLCCILAYDRNTLHKKEIERSKF